MNAAPYPLFPKFAAGQIMEFRVWRNTAGRKAKTPIWERHWPTYSWDVGLTELQFAKLVAGGHYEIKAYGAPDEEQLLGTRVLRYHGAVRDNPPDIEQQTAMMAPTAHETAQRALVTVPGLSPELNAALAAFQMQSTNYREDAQKVMAAMFELMGVWVAREKNTTLEQQLIIDLRAENAKLAANHEKLIKELQETEIEGVEIDARSKAKLGLAGMAVEAIANKLPEMLKPLAETALRELLSKPEYVQEVAKAHGALNASATISDAAE